MQKKNALLENVQQCRFQKCKKKLRKNFLFLRSITVNGGILHI